MPASKEQQLKTARRRNRVLKLRERGASYRDIASALKEQFGESNLPKGYDERYAHQDLTRALEQTKDDLEETAQQVRRLEVRRLNRMLREFYAIAIDSTAPNEQPPSWKMQKEAVDRVLKIMKRRAKLRGLDAPDQVELSTGDVEWDDFTDEELQMIIEGEDVQTVLEQRENQPVTS